MGKFGNFKSGVNKRTFFTEEYKEILSEKKDAVEEENSYEAVIVMMDDVKILEFLTRKYPEILEEFKRELVEKEGK